MKFSIVAAVYNKEKYLPNFFASIEAQTYGDYDVVLIDDGSTDLSGKLCDKYAQQNPTKVKVVHQKNAGVLLAKRKALQCAEGDYVLLADADDILECTLLEDVKNKLEATQADICLYNESVMDGYGVKKDVPGGHFDETVIYTDDRIRDIFRKIIDDPGMHAMWRKVIRRNIIDVNKDYSEASFICIGDDLLQTIEVYNAARVIAYIDKPLYTYRGVSSGLSHNYRTDMYASFAYVYKILEGYLDKWDMSEDKERLYSYFISIVYDDLVKASHSKYSNKVIRNHMKKIWNDSYFKHIYGKIEVKNMGKTRKIMLYLLRMRCYRILRIFLTLKEEKR